MKQRIILLLLVLLALNLNAQKYNVFKGDTINRVDEKGLKQGIWKKYYSNDVLFSEGMYKNGKHIGVFKTYYKEGKPQSILRFRNISEISDAELFSADSGLMARGKYIDRLKDSVWTYYDTNGKLSAQEQYINGKKEGVWKIFYPNAQVSRMLVYRSDKKNGPYKEYFSDGKAKIDGVMKNDEFDGIVIVYHPNGKIWQKGLYKNGLKDGKWLINKETGEIEREDLYKAGNWLNPISEDNNRIPEKE